MEIRRDSNRRRKRGALVVSALLATVGALSVAAPAQAAPGDAFDPDRAAAFVSYGTAPSLTLNRLVVGSDGAASYTQEGTVTYTNDLNGLAYNLDDNYIYGITNAAGNGMPAGALVRIGQEGVITQVGTELFPAGLLGPGESIIDQGVYNPDDGRVYFVSTDRPNMLWVDPAVPFQNGLIPLSDADSTGGWDIAYQGGYFWSMRDATLLRTDPATGARTSFPVPGASTSTGAAGAAWTFGNGNVGFAHNSGTVTQLEITDASSDTPTFEVISQGPGASSARNDGTSIPGLPADLSIVKAAEVSDDVQSVTYTLTVENLGAGNSTGWVIDDEVPGELTGVAVSGDGAAQVDGNSVKVTGGALEIGETATITITASLPDPFEGAIENVATVVGNEVDPDDSNNSSPATIEPPAPAIDLEKRIAEIVDVNDDGVVDSGDAIMWEFEVTNTGEVPLTGVGVDDPLAGEVVCDPDVLAPSEVVVCTPSEPYTITDADEAAGEVVNVATASGTDPSGSPVESEPSSTRTVVEPTPAPAIDLEKRIAEIVDVNDDGVVDSGDAIMWEFEVTNTGNVPLTGIGVDDPLAGEVVCDPDVLAPSEVVVCTPSEPYTITDADEAAGEVVNVATASGTDPSGSPVESEPSSTRTVVEPTPAAPASPTLPATGAEVPWIGVAAAMLMLGVGIPLAIRRGRKVL